MSVAVVRAFVKLRRMASGFVENYAGTSLRQDFRLREATRDRTAWRARLISSKRSMTRISKQSFMRSDS